MSKPWPQRKKQQGQQQGQQQQQQQDESESENIEKRRYKYDMAHAEALRGGTLKMGERPPPTLRDMHFPSARTTTTTTTKKVPTLTKAEQEATLALQGLEKAESLKHRQDLVGAKRLYELSIGVLIKYLNNNTEKGNSKNNKHLSKEVIAARVGVALTDAEEIKQTLEIMEQQTPKKITRQQQQQQQQRQSSWSSLSQSLTYALGGGSGGKKQQQESEENIIDLTLENDKKESTNTKKKSKIPSRTTTGPRTRSQRSQKPINDNNNNNDPSYQKQTHASRQQQQQTQSRHRPATTTKTTTTTYQTKPKPKPSSNLPKHLIETIKQDFYVPSSTLSTTWNDISGLQTAKRSIQEAAILPLLRPDLYTGLRSPPRGILLYGPPGTGKTMLVKAAAKESDCLLFSASASVLTSKWHGEGEKIVRALFAFAKDVSPSMIFLDEIDAILSSRNENEHEASRRMKTEFMIQMDGITKNSSCSNNSNGSSEQQQQQHADDVQHQVLVLGCTNCPWDIDDAIMRRFTRRIYVPLPDTEARRTLLSLMLKKVEHSLSKRQIETLVRATEGYSCSDIASIGNEASFGPLRSIGDLDVIKGVDRDEVRPMNMGDFEDAMDLCKKSVTSGLLERYEKWERELSGH